LKRLYLFSIRSFAGPFIITLIISMFILILQFFWVYIDDLMGKGLSVLVILELLFYVSASLIPLALPLAILLSSLMTFGNLSENNELTALKSSGLSLYQIMRPLMVVVVGIACFTFYFANYVIPVSNLKWHSLIYDIQNTKISTVLTPGVYTKDFEGYAIKVKEGKDSVYRGITIHDHTTPTEIKTVKAEEARVYKSENGRFLFFDLKNGRVYEEMDIQNPVFSPNGNPIRNRNSTRPSRVSSFEKGIYKLNISGFSLNRSEEDIFTDKYEMMNVFQISDAMDSLKIKKNKILDQFAQSLRSQHASMVRSNGDSQNENSGLKELNVRVVDFDELPKSEKINTYNSVISGLYNKNETLTNQIAFLETTDNESNLYWIEFHRKFALTYAIIVLFFVGAPLGAIIRKGGFGAPVVIAALVFMLYFILISIGENLATTKVLGPFMGMWIAGIFFTPIAVLITWAAANDAQIFNKEAWFKLFKRKTS
jgi:lipopolysaccharide export system permease protein